MKRISKYIAAVAGLTVLAVAAFSMSPVLADSPGQLEGGGSVYEVRDLTQNGSYANTISAKAGDLLEYSVELHNDAYGSLTSINVAANLPGNSATSNTSTVVATTNLAGTSGANGSVTVNLSSAETINYVNGTTILYNGQGVETQKMADGITSQSGINAGGLMGSTIEYVNFEARVNTPVVPTPPAPCGTCNYLSLTGTEPTYTAAAHYTVTNGASVNGVSFNWGDGSTTAGVTNTNGVVTSAPHTFTTPGTYKVVATVTFSNGVASSDCSTSVTIPKPPVTPAPCGTCNLLSLTGTEPTFTASAHYTVTNGASIEGVSFNWGDGVATNGLTNANNVVTSAPHTYTTPGTYKIVATVTFSNGVAASSCSTSVTIPKPPVTPTPPVVTPPATLVNTGPCDVIALFAVTTVVGAVAHRLYSRRFARS